MKHLFTLIFAMILISMTAMCFCENAVEESKDKPVLKIQVKKGDIFRYVIHAETIREVRTNEAKEEILNKIDDVLEVEVTQTCKAVQGDENMVLENTYGPHKLVRSIVESGKTRKEIYTPESLTISDENGVTITKKWNEMPSSEQPELRKLFVQGFSFIISPNGKIIDDPNISAYERELPGLNIVRTQQAVYYTGHPMEDSTIWSWKEAIVFPKMKDHPLSGRTIPMESEYELVETKEVAGISCAVISIKQQSNYKDEDENVEFSRELVEKANMEAANGMAIYVEGTAKSELSYGGLSKGIKITVSSKFTIKRAEAK